MKSKPTNKLEEWKEIEDCLLRIKYSDQIEYVVKELSSLFKSHYKSLLPEKRVKVPFEDKGTTAGIWTEGYNSAIEDIEEKLK